MTISAQTTNRTSATGNGVTTSFSFPYPFTAQADLVVLLVLVASPFTQTTQVLSTDYTITGTADAQGRYGSGGNVVFVTAPSSLYNVVIYADPSVAQGLDLVENDPLPAEQVELGLDKLTLLVRRLSDRISRVFRLPDSSVSTGTTTVEPVASQLLAFDASKNLVCVAATSVATTLVSSYIQTLITAVTAAAARLTLGFSAIAAKGDLFVGTAANTIATKTVGANGKTIVSDSTQSDGLVWTDYIRPPLNINPNWLLDQINEGAAYSVAAATVQGPDGWSGKATGAGTFTMQRVTDPDNADLLALKVSCTVADATIGATDDYTIFTAVEGYDVAWLNPGLASAGQISVRFKAKFPAAGTYGVWLQNSAQNRSYLQVLAVADANENEYTLTWTLDTTGTWLLTNGVGLYLGIDLASGSNFQSTVGTWQAGNFKCTSAQTNFMALNTNVMYLKRVNLVPGAVALPYAAQDDQRELAKGQRYYWKSFVQGTAPASGTGVNGGECTFAASVAGAANNRSDTFRLPVEARAVPTFTGFNPAAAGAQIRDVTAGGDCSAAAIQTSGTNGFFLFCVGNAGTAAGGQLGLHVTANARLS